MSIITEIKQDFSWYFFCENNTKITPFKTILKNSFFQGAFACYSLVVLAPRRVRGSGLPLLSGAQALVNYNFLSMFLGGSDICNVNRFATVKSWRPDNYWN